MRPADRDRAVALRDVTDRLVYLLGTDPTRVEAPDRAAIRRAFAAGWRPHAPSAVDLLVKLLGKDALAAALRGE